MSQLATQIQEFEDLQKFLTEMKSFIESKQHADWSQFNRAKKMFLDSFKVIETKPEKQKIWKDFTDVADQARAIRKVQEEEGEFAAEMIAKALDALDQEFLSLKQTSAHHALFQKVPGFKKVSQQMSLSLSRQKFLSTKADQIQSLRDELSKTGMRLSIKGRLFDRLSNIGDKVFPEKKL